MTTMSFREVRKPVRRYGACPVCGKKVTRRETFTQTINPFNVNKDGQMKTWDEIWAELGVTAAAWEPDFRHEACTEGVAR